MIEWKDIWPQYKLSVVRRRCVDKDSSFGQPAGVNDRFSTLMAAAMTVYARASGRHRKFPVSSCTRENGRDGSSMRVRRYVNASLDMLLCYYSKSACASKAKGKPPTDHTKYVESTATKRNCKGSGKRRVQNPALDLNLLTNPTQKEIAWRHTKAVWWRRRERGP